MEVSLNSGRAKVGSSKSPSPKICPDISVRKVSVFKYFEQEPIQRRFYFSGVLYFGWPNQVLRKVNRHEQTNRLTQLKTFGNKTFCSRYFQIL